MSRLLRWCAPVLVGASVLFGSAAAQQTGRVIANEHERLVWTDRADRVHRAFAEADPERRQAATAFLRGARFPGVVRVGQAVHLLAGMSPAELEHPLQKLVDGLDLQLRPAVLAFSVPGARDHRTTHIATVLALTPSGIRGQLQTTLTWQCSGISRHGRQEPVAAEHFDLSGFEMYLPDPRRADDPKAPWMLVPSVVQEGRRFVGLPLSVPNGTEDGVNEHVGANERASAGRARLRANGERSLDALTGPFGIEPLELRPGSEPGASPQVSGLTLWRHPADPATEWSGTLLFPTHHAESAAGPLVGLVGDRWRESGPRGFEKIALDAGVRRAPEFVAFLAERRARGPVVLVLRGDAAARWMLTGSRSEAAFDAVVLSSNFLSPVRAFGEGVPVLWVAGQAQDMPAANVSGIASQEASLLDEPLLAGRVAEWLVAQQEAGAIRR